jgi:hypothetical protein
VVAMRSDSRHLLLGLLAAIITALLPADAMAAERLLYDVTTFEFAASTVPTLSSSGPVRIEVIDNGPATPQGPPRWTSSSGPSFAVWDSPPPDLSDADAQVFGHHCAAMGEVLPDGAVPRTVQDSFGGGTFAWLPSRVFSPDGALDPYAFFCLKGTHQSTTTWSEWVIIGKRVRETPPPPAQQVTIALTPNQTVKGSVPVKISATGFAAGTLKYFISVDDVQKWFWSTSATTITQWWGTTAYPNGTHRVTVRVTDSAGKTATSTVTVLVGN